MKDLKEMSLEEYVDGLFYLDWNYHFADDMTAYRLGRQQIERWHTHAYNMEEAGDDRWIKAFNLEHMNWQRGVNSPRQRNNHRL